MSTDATTEAPRQLRLHGAASLRLAADAWGSPTDRPVLLLHGGGQTRHAWGGTAAALAAAGWYAQSIDLRGHGDSTWSPDGDYSLDAFIADLERVVADQRQPPVLVGASLGGLTSLIAVGERSLEAAALVLVDVAPRLELDGTRRILAFMSARPDGFASIDEAADAIATYLPHRPRPRETSGLAKNLRQREDGRWYWHWDPRFVGSGRGPADATNVTRLEAAARALTLPTLLVRGAQSDVVSPEGAAAFLALVPHARYIDVRDAAHMVAGDRNDVFTTAVAEFLGGLDGERVMIEWNEQHLMIRDAMRRFIEAEIKPHLEELEHGDMPPYDILRKMMQTFGLDELARQRFAKRIAREKEAAASGATPEPRERTEGGEDAGLQFIPIIELCRYCPGMVTAVGVSVGLTGNAILGKGTIRQKERWALPLLTMEKIGAWAITEPGSGSDAFGGMKSTARHQGDGYVLNGSKTFITNGPYADTIVFICKLDDGSDAKNRPVVTFVLDKGMPGLTQSKPMRKMGLHSSPTGELFLDDVQVEADRLLGESEQSGGRSGAERTFSSERTGVAAMALGIVEQCRDLSIDYARTRVQFGRPIGEFQLIQLKLARMEVARMNLQNLIFRQIEMAEAGKHMDLSEASACKLYSAQTAMEVALEAVQLFGGNGYMAEFQVEQLCRDAKVLQIYAGTDEIQVSQIAREMLASR